MRLTRLMPMGKTQRIVDAEACLLLDWPTIKPNQEIKPDKLEFSEGY